MTTKYVAVLSLVSMIGNARLKRPQCPKCIINVRQEKTFIKTLTVQKGATIKQWSVFRHHKLKEKSLFDRRLFFKNFFNLVENN